METGLSPFVHFVISGVIIYISMVLLRLLKIKTDNRSTILTMIWVTYMAFFIPGYLPLTTIRGNMSDIFKSEQPHNVQPL